MTIYLLVVFLIVVMRMRLNSVPIILRDKKEKYCLQVVCWILVLLAALRASTVGSDTSGYIADYDAIISISWAEVFERYGDYLGYFILSKICSLLHLPIQVLFGIVEGIYLYSMYKFTSRFSEDKLYTMLCFEMIGLYSFSLAGLKQVLSMAFVLFYYMAMMDKKYIQTIALAVVAYLCHYASLIFLAGLALYYIRNWRFYYWALVGIVLLSLLGTNFLWANMLGMLANDHYSELYMADEGYSNTTMIFYGVLLLLLFVFSGNYRKQRKVEARIVLGMSTLAFVFQAFSLISSAAFRLSFYFLPMMIVGFPNAFNRIGNKETVNIVKLAVLFMIVVFFVYSNRNGGSVVPYKFFWQE